MAKALEPVKKGHVSPADIPSWPNAGEPLMATRRVEAPGPPAPRDSCCHGFAQPQRRAADQDRRPRQAPLLGGQASRASVNTFTGPTQNFTLDDFSASNDPDGIWLRLRVRNPNPDQVARLGHWRSVSAATATGRRRVVEEAL